MLTLNAMSKIIIQYAYANQAIREIHNTDASNWNVSQMMNVQMIKHATTMNALIHVSYQIHAP